MLPVKGFREWLHLEWWLYYTYLYCFERFLLACVVMNCHSSFSLSPFIVSQLVLNGTHGFKDIRRGGRGILLISWNLENGFPCWSVFKKKYENKKKYRARITFWKSKDQNQVIFFTSPNWCKNGGLHPFFRDWCIRLTWYCTQWKN